jgi:hypothetical protein
MRVSGRKSLGKRLFLIRTAGEKLTPMGVAKGLSTLLQKSYPLRILKMQ